MNSKQLTLDGDVTHQDRTVPDTFVVCKECGDRMLRSKLPDHTHSKDVSPIVYQVQISLQAMFEIELDPESVPRRSNLEDEARSGAIERFQKNQGNFRPETDILDVKPSTN